MVLEQIGVRVLQISSDFFRFLQISSDFFRFLADDFFRFLQIPSGLFRFLQVSSDFFRFLQISQKVRPVVAAKVSCALGRRRAGAAGAPLPKRRLTFPPTRAEYTF